MGVAPAITAVLYILRDIILTLLTTSNPTSPPALYTYGLYVSTTAPYISQCTLCLSPHNRASPIHDIWGDLVFFLHLVHFTVCMFSLGGHSFMHILHNIVYLKNICDVIYMWL